MGRNYSLPYRFCAFGVFLLTAVSAAANTIHVPADHATIQAAIDAAVAGDVVLVSDGTYLENINFKGKAITLKSVNGPSVTIIDGNAADTVITFSSGETSSSVLDGFTIRNGAVASGSTFSGSGIYVGSSSPTIKNNIISDNLGCQGSGVDVQFGSPLVQDNTITHNSQGGCSGGTGGGGILIGGASQPQILHNTITNNSIGVDGGGISLFAAGSPTISGNTISGNTAAGSGGGIAMANDSNAIVTDNVFTGNTAFQGGGVAALVPSGAPGPSIINNTFFANNASNGGSEFYLDGFYSQTNLFNNIFVGSASQTAVLCDTQYSSDPPILQFNDAYNPQGIALGGACSALAGSNSNISVDPLFVNAPGDFHLQATSPVVDVGSNSAPNIPEKDIAGNDRILDGGGHCSALVDMGAYELARASSLIFNPTNFIFPAQLVGSTSSSLPATITNNGSANATVCSVNISGDFAQTNNCGVSIAANASCSVGIAFSPTAHGQRSGFLQIVTSDAGSPQTIALSGTAVAPVFSASPTMFRFPESQQVGTTSSAATITVTNLGDGALHISNIAITGDFAESNNCPDQLSPSASCDYAVTFSPNTAGERSGVLTITDNGGPHPITLYGAANDFSLTAATNGGTHATVAAGTTANYNLEVAAANGFNSTVTLTCAGAPLQAICTVVPASATPAGSSVLFTVSVATTAPSAHTLPAPFSSDRLFFASLVGICFFSLNGRGTGVRYRQMRLPLLLILLLALAWTAACGGGSSSQKNPGTPGGNYTLTVTGTANGVSRPLSLTLTVN
jgi:parallel beta-helix repeat protein